MIALKKSILVPDDAPAGAVAIEGTPQPLATPEPDGEPTAAPEAGPAPATAYKAVMGLLPNLTTPQLHALRMYGVRAELQRRRGIAVIPHKSESHTPIDSIPGEKL